MSLKRASWLLLLASACAGATPPPPQHTSPRLLRAAGKLYVRNAPAGLKRDSLLYALAAKPLPGSSDHPKIGILRGVDRVGESLQVGWYTLLDDDVDADLAGEGLPVLMIGQDLEPRIGRHWGKYLAQPGVPFPRSPNPIVLQLNLGRRDGVEPGDKYALLGEPQADALNRTVDSFAPIGTCTVPPFGLQDTRAPCQLDMGLEKSGFEERHWARDGYVRAMTPRERKR